MANFCVTCGAATEPAARFCKSCGAVTEAAQPAQPAPPPQYAQPAPPPQAYPPPPQPQYAPPPPPPQYAPPPQAYPPQQQYGQPSYPPPPGAAPGGPSGFENSCKSTADSIVRSMNLNPTGGPPGLIEKLVRGAFFDSTIYRNAAADPNDNGGAIIAYLIPMVAGFISSFFFRSMFAFTFFGAWFYLRAALFGLVGTFAALGAMSAVSPSIVGRKLGIGEIFRGVAYAQSPGILAIIPVLGAFISAVWRLVSSVFAISAISGGDIGKAIVLGLVGFVATIIVGAVLAALFIGSAAVGFGAF